MGGGEHNTYSRCHFDQKSLLWPRILRRNFDNTEHPVGQDWVKDYGQSLSFLKYLEFCSIHPKATSDGWDLYSFHESSWPRAGYVFSQAVAEVKRDVFVWGGE